MTPEELARLTLALVSGIGRSRYTSLLARFESARAVLTASISELGRIRGMSRAAATAIRGSSVERTTAIVEKTRALGGLVLLETHQKFPPALRTIPETPIVLFAVGNLDLLSRDAVAIVGSRTHSRYGAEVCRHFSSGLATAGLVVVSGMARGLDAVAHVSCMDAGGGTVGVLGNGLGVVYPAANRKLYERVAESGCLITEFPPGERPHAGSFPRRNRLISGLARCTLVVEAGERSGTLLTVGNALEQGREVLVVPGPVTSPLSRGCNRLLQDGAKPALGLKDVLEEYGLAARDVDAQTLPGNLSDLERRTLETLAQGHETIDDIAVSLECGISVAMAVLTGLEIRGVVAQAPGKIFRRAFANGVV